jgi:hypothetical protein
MKISPETSEPEELRQLPSWLASRKAVLSRLGEGHRVFQAHASFPC